MTRHLFLATIVILAACNGKKDTTDTSKIVATGTGDAPGCGTDAPVITALTAKDDGMTAGDTCGTQSWPQVLITADVTSADGDLSYHTLRIWWDATVDGNVDTTSPDYLETSGTIGQNCKVFTASVGMDLCLNGAKKVPPFSTTVEFGAIVMDADWDHDTVHQSDVATTTYDTPAAP